MQTSIPVLFLVATAAFAAGAVQTGQEDQDTTPVPRLDPMTAFREEEAVRLDEDLEGAWMLVTYQNVDEQVPAEDFRGFALFHDGFLSLTLQGRYQEEAFFGGPRDAYLVQTMVYRYRLSEQLMLQLSGMMGFGNDNERREMRFEGANVVREYFVSIADDLLTIWHPDGRRFAFRSVTRGAFPKEAIEALQGIRGGLPFDEDD